MCLQVWQGVVTLWLLFFGFGFLLTRKIQSDQNVWILSFELFAVFIF